MNIKDAIVDQVLRARAKKRGEKDVNPDEFVKAPNRRDVRRFSPSFAKPIHMPGLGVREILARGPHYARYSGPTGRPKWWDAMKRDSLARRHLSDTPPVALDAVSELLGTRLQACGFPSVYALSRAATADLLDVQGIGPATLRKIRREMIDRGIPVKWEAPA